MHPMGGVVPMVSPVGPLVGPCGPLWDAPHAPPPLWEVVGRVCRWSQRVPETLRMEVISDLHPEMVVSDRGSEVQTQDDTSQMTCWWTPYGPGVHTPSILEVVWCTP